jgi:hypothetical protein
MEYAMFQLFEEVSFVYTCMCIDKDVVLQVFLVLVRIQNVWNANTPSMYLAWNCVACQLHASPTTSSHRDAELLQIAYTEVEWEKWRPAISGIRMLTIAIPLTLWR